jgi:hypothetical protein
MEEDTMFPSSRPKRDQSQHILVGLKIDLHPQKLQFLDLEPTKATGTQALRCKILNLPSLDLKERVSLTSPNQLDLIRALTFTLPLLKRTKIRHMSSESLSRLSITKILVQISIESMNHLQRTEFNRQLLELSQDQTSGRKKLKVQRTSPNLELMREPQLSKPTRRKHTPLELPMKQNIITTPDQVSTLRVTM